MVGWYALRVTNPDEAVRVTRTVDETFANSPWETKTETESAFAASWVKQMGNIELPTQRWTGGLTAGSMTSCCLPMP